MATCIRIARNAFLGVLIGCCAVDGLGQAAQSAPAQITISAVSSTSSTIVAGDKMMVTTELKNVSDHPVNVSSFYLDYSHEDLSYGFHVTTEDGTVLGHKQPPKDNRPVNGSVVMSTIQPGQTVSITHCVSCLYDHLDVAGRYRIYASRNVDGVRVNSNEITITVVPKGQGAAQ